VRTCLARLCSEDAAANIAFDYKFEIYVRIKQ
jgi:hypothetical protein